MTQAFNLSQLANRVNTSGQLNIATGATGTLPVANGGTGLTAVGTNGQVLSSNGSAMVWTTPSSGGVTSLNGQTGAIVDTTLGNIGSVVWAMNNTGTAIAGGGTIAGSSLFYLTSAGTFNTQLGTGTRSENYLSGANAKYFAFTYELSGYPGNPGGPPFASALSGTWRCMGAAPARFYQYDFGYNSTSARFQFSLFVRVS